MARGDPVQTARRFARHLEPAATAAFLGGSVIRGDDTATSDLDIVVIADGSDLPYRVTAELDEWPVEGFVHTADSLIAWIEAELLDHQQTLARMVLEGPIVVDEGEAEVLREAVADLVGDGPPPLGSAAVDAYRYAVTDLMLDLEAPRNAAEARFVAHHLGEKVAQLQSLISGGWLGSAKWAYRELEAVDPDSALDLTTALERFATRNDASPLLQVADRVLDGVGGRLFAGYRQSGVERDRAVRDRLRRSLDADD